LKQYRYMAALSAIMLAAALAAIGVAATGEFEALAVKEGPAALEVVDYPTLYRVAEMQALPCSASEFEFLLDRPRVSMTLARALDPELDEYEIQMKPDGSCHVDDNGRLVGDMELVDSGPGRRVYYITGHWKFVLGITFEGRMVLVPEYEERMVDGVSEVNARARGYMKIDNALIGFMARVVAFVFPGKVDARIKRFAGSVRKVAEAIRKDPEEMYAKLMETGKVPPEEALEYRAMFMGGRAGGRK